MEIIYTVRLVLFLASLYNIISLCQEKDEDAASKIPFNVLALLIAGLLADPASWPDRSYFFDHITRVIVIFVINSIVWGALFWVSFIVRLFFMIQAKIKDKKERSITQQKNSDAAKLLALEELESGKLDKLTWAKAIIAAGGDEEKARGEYLKLRKIETTDQNDC